MSGGLANAGGVLKHSFFHAAGIVAAGVVAAKTGFDIHGLFEPVVDAFV